MIAVRVDGPPVPWARARKRKGAGYFTAEPQRERAAEIKAAWEGHPMLEGPVSLRLLFAIPRPKSHIGRRGTVMPRFEAAIPPTDLDNFAKLVLDALNGAAYHDDRQVIQLYARKRWIVGKGYTEIEVLQGLTTGLA